MLRYNMKTVDPIARRVLLSILKTMVFRGLIGRHRAPIWILPKMIVDCRKRCFRELLKLPLNRDQLFYILRNEWSSLPNDLFASFAY